MIYFVWEMKPTAIDSDGNPDVEMLSVLTAVDSVVTGGLFPATRVVEAVDVINCKTTAVNIRCYGISIQKPQRKYCA